MLWKPPEVLALDSSLPFTCQHFFQIFFLWLAGTKQDKAEQNFPGCLRSLSLASAFSLEVYGVLSLGSVLSYLLPFLYLVLVPIVPPSILTTTHHDSVITEQHGPLSALPLDIPGPLEFFFCPLYLKWYISRALFCFPSYFKGYFLSVSLWLFSLPDPYW